MTEEVPTPIVVPTPTLSAPNDMSDSIRKRNTEELVRKEQEGKQHEESRKSQNYLKIKNAMTQCNAGYEEAFTALEKKGFLYHQLEPEAIWNYCKTFYDGQCDIAKYLSNPKTKKVFEDIVESEEYLPMMHRYDDLQLLQERVESIVEWKKDQEIELQRESISFMGAGGNATNGKSTPRDSYNAWRNGNISTEELSSGIDKFYRNRHGANYIGVKQKLGGR